MGKFRGCVCFTSLIHTTWWDDIPYEIFFPVNCILRVWLYFSLAWRAWHQNLRLVIEKWAFRNFHSLRTANAFPLVASLLPKNSVCEPRAAKRFPWRKTFCCDVGQSDQRNFIGFRRELMSNSPWNVNFTTITRPRFPATLNADFFMKQLLLMLSMWCGPLVSPYKIR